MKRRLLLALVAGLMAGSDPAAPDLGEVKQEQVIPPGSKWVEIDEGGVWEFGKNGVLGGTNPDGTKLLPGGRYTLDTARNPPHIDTSEIDGVMTGIYRLDGDRLVLCLSLGERPTKFVDEPDGPQFLVILERLK
jgi:uncharacterized protein (TIGR03067 family)